MTIDSYCSHDLGTIVFHRSSTVAAENVNEAEKVKAVVVADSVRVFFEILKMASVVIVLLVG